MTIEPRNPPPSTSPPPPSFRSPQQAAAVALMRASDTLRRRLSEVLGPFGVTLQQFNVLRILRGAGPNGLPTLTIAGRMVERAPGVTRLLDRLEAEAWIERVRDVEDRRRVVARITEGGRDLLARVDEPFARAEDEAFGALVPDEVGVLVRYLDSVHGLLDSMDRSIEVRD